MFQVRLFEVRSKQGMKNQQFTRATIGVPEPWLIEAAAEINLNLVRFVHETTNQFEDHVLNRHGDPTFHGTATITAADFALIPGIIQAPDMAIIGVKRRKRLINVYVKAENGVTYLYFEEILQGRKNKALRGCTFYKVTRPLTVDDVLKNITRNDKTDISGAKVYNPVKKQ
jgi:hypothetical protein